jgi:hypothetical protein
MRWFMVGDLRVVCDASTLGFATRRTNVLKPRMNLPIADELGLAGLPKGPPQTWPKCRGGPGGDRPHSKPSHSTQGGDIMQIDKHTQPEKSPVTQAFGSLVSVRVGLADNVRHRSVAALNRLLAHTSALRDLYKVALANLRRHFP